MINFCKHLIENDLTCCVLNDSSLLYLLNKKEINFLYFYLIRNNGLNIKYIKEPTEEMKLEAVKNNGYVIKYIKKPNR